MPYKTTFIFIMLISNFANAECKKHIEVHSAKHIANQLDKSEMWVLGNYKINLWANESPKKFPKVGELLPGSKAVIVEESTDDYKVISPFDQSTGWISKIQVDRTLMQDTKTRRECKSK